MLLHARPSIPAFPQRFSAWKPPHTTPEEVVSTLKGLKLKEVCNIGDYNQMDRRSTFDKKLALSVSNMKLWVQRTENGTLTMCAYYFADGHDFPYTVTDAEIPQKITLTHEGTTQPLHNSREQRLEAGSTIRFPNGFEFTLDAIA